MSRQHVLVTGGSMGIGLSVSRALAANGARVTLMARGAEALRLAVAELPGEGHRAYQLDVADEQGWPAVVARLGRLDGLVCAAAVLGPIGAAGTYAPADFRRTLEVNLFGTLLAIHHCLPGLRASEGAIVTFGGGGATAPLPRYDAYASSKVAVVRLTENLAEDLSETGVRINCVAPGFIATRLHQGTLDAGAQAAGPDYYLRTQRELESGGAPIGEAAELVCLLLGSGQQVPFTGKLISAQWDPWRNPEFISCLANDGDLATLRRVEQTANGIVAVQEIASRGSISVVVPAYNEEDNVERVYERLRTVLDGLEMEWELIFSVDPSTDRTEELILGLRKRDRRVKMLRFSRRVGQPMATIAGLEASVGDATVVIDCDLQDPPELIRELVARWRDGYDVVYAQRRTRAGETLPKRIVAAIGYRVIARIAEVAIPPNTGDFRLLSRRVVDNVVALRESHGFLRGLVALVGFRSTNVLYDRDPRVAGTSKYNRFWGSLVIGLNGLIGFSRYPLQLISAIGVALSGLAFLLAVTYLLLKLAGQNFPVGNPTVVIVVAFFSGIQLLSLGVIGEYVGRIYDESRRRPKYIVESQYGWDENPGQ